jgi:ankyrin repeat protein
MSFCRTNASAFRIGRRLFGGGDVFVAPGLGTNHRRQGHTPLYSVANECASGTGPDIVRALVQAGADVNACGGVTRATALHMAARRGHIEIARALLDCGAAAEARDRKGNTPLERALNCRRRTVVELLKERGL